MKNRTSVAARLVRSVAERIAADPRIPAENRAAMRDTAESVLWSEMRRLFVGERASMYVPTAGAEERQARDQRIQAALHRGEAQDSIARREAVSTRHVERVKSRRPLVQK